MKNKIIDNFEYFPNTLMYIIISIITFTLTVVSFIKWLHMRYLLYAIFCFFCIIGFIVFFFPIILNQKIYINGDNITFRYGIGPPMTVKISNSLYQIVTKKGKIVHFRFRAGIRRAQISPSAYKNGHKLLAHLKDILNKQKIIVEIINK